jgi:hypothetical protein
VFSSTKNFNLTQHIRDAGLFKFIQGWLGCGLIYEIHKESRVNLVIMKLQYIFKILIPRLNKILYLLALSPKGIHYHDYCSGIGTMGQWDNGTMGQWDNGSNLFFCLCPYGPRQEGGYLLRRYAAAGTLRCCVPGTRSSNAAAATQQLPASRQVTNCYAAAAAKVNRTKRTFNFRL